MRDFLKQIKADYLLSSILCILLGVIFVIFKGGVIDMIGTVLAVAMIAIGVIYLGSFFLSIMTNGVSVVMGILVLAVGIWFLIQPSFVVSLIPIIIGVVLLFHGIRGVMEAVSAKKFGYERWAVSLILAIICLVCGIVCVFCPLGVMEKAIMLIGIVLIFNGVTNIWISATATHAARDFERRNETVDVHFMDDEGGRHA